MFQYYLSVNIVEGHNSKNIKRHQIMSLLRYGALTITAITLTKTCTTLTHTQSSSNPNTPSTIHYLTLTMIFGILFGLTESTELRHLHLSLSHNTLSTTTTLITLVTIHLSHVIIGQVTLAY